MIRSATVEIKDALALAPSDTWNLVRFEGYR
jgi:hypothetical protein